LALCPMSSSLYLMLRRALLLGVASAGAPGHAAELLNLIDLYLP
jgi:hypothetical protein